jgi:hypothetical protein
LFSALNFRTKFERKNRKQETETKKAFSFYWELMPFHGRSFITILTANECTCKGIWDGVKNQHQSLLTTQDPIHNSQKEIISFAELFPSLRSHQVSLLTIILA